jgi:hypothetical protein
MLQINLNLSKVIVLLKPQPLAQQINKQLNCSCGFTRCSAAAIFKPQPSRFRLIPRKVAVT